VSRLAGVLVLFPLVLISQQRYLPLDLPIGQGSPLVESNRGDYKKMLKYQKDRIFAFVNALGDVNAEWAANAAGAIKLGFSDYCRY